MVHDGQCAGRMRGSRVIASRTVSQWTGGYVIVHSFLMYFGVKMLFICIFCYIFAQFCSVICTYTFCEYVISKSPVTSIPVMKYSFSVIWGWISACLRTLLPASVTICTVLSHVSLSCPSCSKCCCAIKASICGRVWTLHLALNGQWMYK